MGTAKLNSYSSDDVKSIAERYSNAIAKTRKVLAKDAPLSLRVRQHRFLMMEMRTRGLLGIALDEPVTDIRLYLGESVAACQRLVAISRQPSECNPVMLTEGVELAALLADIGAARKLAGWRTYEVAKYEDSEFVADALVMGYVVSMQALILGDVNKAKAVAHSNATAAAGKSEAYAKRLSAHSAAIAAIVERDASAFAAAMASLLEWQERESRRGRLRESPEGLACLSGLALVRLAADEGLAYEANNPYLPLRILG